MFSPTTPIYSYDSVRKIYLYNDAPIPTLDSPGVFTPFSDTFTISGLGYAHTQTQIIFEGRVTFTANSVDDIPLILDLRVRGDSYAILNRDRVIYQGELCPSLSSVGWIPKLSGRFGVQLDTLGSAFARVIATPVMYSAGIPYVLDEEELGLGVQVGGPNFGVVAGTRPGILVISFDRAVFVEGVGLLSPGDRDLSLRIIRGLERVGAREEVKYFGNVLSAGQQKVNVKVCLSGRTRAFLLWWGWQCGLCDDVIQLIAEWVDPLGMYEAFSWPLSVVKHVDEMERGLTASNQSVDECLAGLSTTEKLGGVGQGDGIMGMNMEEEEDSSSLRLRRRQKIGMWDSIRRHAGRLASLNRILHAKSEDTGDETLTPEVVSRTITTLLGWIELNPPSGETILIDPVTSSVSLAMKNACHCLGAILEKNDVEVEDGLLLRISRTMSRQLSELSDRSIVALSVLSFVGRRSPAHLHVSGLLASLVTMIQKSLPNEEIGLNCLGVVVACLSAPLVGELDSEELLDGVCGILKTVKLDFAWSGLSEIVSSIVFSALDSVPDAVAGLASRSNWRSSDMPETGIVTFFDDPESMLDWFGVLSDLRPEKFPPQLGLLIRDNFVSFLNDSHRIRNECREKLEKLKEGRAAGRSGKRSRGSMDDVVSDPSLEIRRSFARCCSRVLPKMISSLPEDERRKFSCDCFELFYMSDERFEVLDDALVSSGDVDRLLLPLLPSLGRTQCLAIARDCSQIIKDWAEMIERREVGVCELLSQKELRGLHRFVRLSISDFEDDPILQYLQSVLSGFLIDVDESEQETDDEDDEIEKKDAPEVGEERSATPDCGFSPAPEVAFLQPFVFDPEMLKFDSPDRSDAIGAFDFQGAPSLDFPETGVPEASPAAFTWNFDEFSVGQFVLEDDQKEEETGGEDS